MHARLMAFINQIKLNKINHLCFFPLVGPPHKGSKKVHTHTHTHIHTYTHHNTQPHKKLNAHWLDTCCIVGDALQLLILKTYTRAPQTCAHKHTHTTTHDITNNHTLTRLNTCCSLVMLCRLSICSTSSSNGTWADTACAMARQQMARQQMA